jgi:hypothetical protein
MRISSHHTPEERVVDAAVQVHKPNISELFLAGESPCGLAYARGGPHSHADIHWTDLLRPSGPPNLAAFFRHMKY